MDLSPAAQTMFLSTRDVERKGLAVFHTSVERKSRKWKLEEFHAHYYGSDALELADVWYDLTTTDIEGAQLTATEKSEKGFRFFLMAHHFLWTYPKNSRNISSRFKICECYCRGKSRWTWVGKIVALKAKKIVWDPRLNQPNIETFILSVDGTDFKMWEKKHPNLPRDPQQCSQKFKHGAVKYEIGLSVFRSQCVWISGPHRAAKHDMTIF
jgi:hypothetical protein